MRTYLGWLGSIGFLLVGVVACGPTTQWNCQEDWDCAGVNWRCQDGECVQRIGDGGTLRDGVSTETKLERLPERRVAPPPERPPERRVTPPPVCTTSQKRSCYFGPKGTAGKGPCRGGTQTCLAGKWGTCVGQVKPTKEICDKKDNDCDGTVDEGVCGAPGACKPGQTSSCYSGSSPSLEKGLCKVGKKTCTSSKTWGPCVGQVTPVPETCDKKDNNCDGIVDNRGVCGPCTPGKKASCYTGPPGTMGIGVCRAGFRTCTAAKTWGPCTGQVVAVAEVCDKKDNNCDGLVDNSSACQQECQNGQKVSCYTGPAGTAGKGTCKAGVKTCVGGKWGACSGQVGPTAEVCDKQDNNCDGVVDNGGVCGECAPGQKASCYTGPAGTDGKGLCKAGVKTCTAARRWGACAGQVGPTAEVCDKKDNNCDGVVDSGGVCGQCTPGAKKSCYTLGGIVGKGRCKAGTSTCTAARVWGGCMGQVGPTAEVCDKQDNDCDGYVDESYPEQSKPCSSGKPGPCAAGLYQCSAGKVVCLPITQPRPEICNGKDDNCNGKIDDGVTGSTFYRDADGDGFGDPNSPTSACLLPPGYVLNKTDCYDKNKWAHPGQANYFSTHRGDGSFDYNCDGQQQKRFVKVGSCKGCTTPVFDQGFVNPNPACGASGNWVNQCRLDVGNKCFPLTIPKKQECR